MASKTIEQIIHDEMPGYTIVTRSESPADSGPATSTASDGPSDTNSPLAQLQEKYDRAIEARLAARRQHHNGTDSSRSQQTNRSGVEIVTVKKSGASSGRSNRERAVVVSTREGKIIGAQG